MDSDHYTRSVDVNMRYLVLMNFNLILMCSNVGFVLAGNNVVGSIVMTAKHGWTDNTNNTIISSCAISGLILGSLFSSKLVVYGRGRADAAAASGLPAAPGWTATRAAGRTPGPARCANGVARRTNARRPDGAATADGTAGDQRCHACGGAT